MADIIGNIFTQKLNEIQARVPVKISSGDKPAAFSDVLKEKVTNLGDKSSDVAQKNMNGLHNTSEKKTVPIETTIVRPQVLSKQDIPQPIASKRVAQNTPSNKDGYKSIIDSASSKYNVDSKLISSVIKAESGFNPNSVSTAGAMGLMQLMPATAAGLGVKNAFDPSQNINGGAGYIKQLLDKYNGDVKLALAAYNCGPGTMRRLDITNLNDKYQMAKLPTETRNYVNKIMGYIEKSD